MCAGDVSSFLRVDFAEPAEVRGILLWHTDNGNDSERTALLGTAVELLGPSDVVVWSGIVSAFAHGRGSWSTGFFFSGDAR